MRATYRIGTTVGRTGLKVSVAGLGTGGFSRLGMKAGKSEDVCARLVHQAVDLGINFIDTAAAYGNEGVVGKALKSIRCTDSLCRSDALTAPGAMSFDLTEFLP